MADFTGYSEGKGRYAETSDDRKQAPASYGLFEVLAADETDQRLASRRALLLAEQRVEGRLGEWLKAASPEEFDAKLAYVQNDFNTIISSACEEVGHTDSDSIANSLRSHFRPEAASKDEFFEKKLKGEDEEPEDDEESDGRISEAALSMASNITNVIPVLEEHGDAPIPDRVSASPKASSEYNPADQKDDSGKKVPCPDCGGDGQTAGGKECPRCKGSGKVNDWGPSTLDALNSKVAAEVCPQCHGTGKEERGEGPVKLDCPRCNGTGKLSSSDAKTAGDGNSGLSSEPSPKMDKAKWTPKTVQKIDVPSDEHPTVEKDPVQPIIPRNDHELKEIGEKTTEKVDLPSDSSDSGFSDGGVSKGDGTKTYPKGKHIVDPVTTETISSRVADDLAGASYPPQVEPPQQQQAPMPYNPAANDELMDSLHPAAKYIYERAMQQGSNPQDAVQQAQNKQNEMLQRATQGQNIEGVEQPVLGHAEGNPVVELVKSEFDGFVPQDVVSSRVAALRQ